VPRAGRWSMCSGPPGAPRLGTGGWRPSASALAGRSPPPADAPTGATHKRARQTNNPTNVLFVLTTLLLLILILVKPTVRDDKPHLMIANPGPSLRGPLTSSSSALAGAAAMRLRTAAGGLAGGAGSMKKMWPSVVKSVRMKGMHARRPPSPSTGAGALPLPD
jgi:hypothetical protein